MLQRTNGKYELVKKGKNSKKAKAVHQERMKNKKQMKEDEWLAQNYEGLNSFFI